MPLVREKELIHRHHFRLAIPGLTTVGYFSVCTGLEMEVEVFQYAEGGNNEFVHNLPGRVRYPNLHLTHGLTDQDALQKWFWATRTKAELREITIELQSPDGRARRTWTFADAFPVKWTGPVVDAGSAEYGTESLEIAHSGLKGA